MRRIVSTALAVSALALMATGAGTIAARAADPALEMDALPQATVGAEPLYIWTGPYAGAFVGYNWGEFDGIAGGDDADGAAGGVYGGYNWDFDRYVFGVEGDIGFSGAETSVGGLDAETGFFGSLRARAGVTVNPFMFYATGGIAGTEATVDGPGGSDSNTHIGWTAGAGAEAFITDNVSARLEYRYTEYGEETYDLPTGPVSSGFDEQSVRAGIGVKF